MPGGVPPGQERSGKRAFPPKLSGTSSLMSGSAGCCLKPPHPAPGPLPSHRGGAAEGRAREGPPRDPGIPGQDGSLTNDPGRGRTQWLALSVDGKVRVSGMPWKPNAASHALTTQ